MTTLTTKSGRLVPSLFYGTAWKKAATTSLVTLALERGFRAIDTACQPRHYSENLVGEAIALSSAINREDIFLQTKFTLPGGQDPNNIPYDVNAPLEDQVRQSFAKSLENLRTEYLDAVLLHSPARTLENTLTIINVLSDFKKTGKLRHIGISNIYSLPMLKEICLQVPPSTIQIVQNRYISYSTVWNVSCYWFGISVDFIFDSGMLLVEEFESSSLVPRRAYSMNARMILPLSIVDFRNSL